MKDKFGEKNKGENLKVLNKASKYFSRQNDDIIRYYFDTHPDEVDKNYLEQEDYKRCEVCGEKLYKMSDKSKYGQIEDIKIRLKRHLVFIDNCGSKHYTCYSLNNCLKKQDLNIESDVIKNDKDYQAPDVKDFFKDYINLNTLDKSFVESLKRNYNKFVKPFLEKWVHRGINKHNVIDFINDLSVIDDKFTKLYMNTNKDYKFFKQKLFRIVGVKYG